jgi:hypothetical protein
MSETPGLEKLAINSDFENVLNCVRNMKASGIVRKLKLGISYFSIMDLATVAVNMSNEGSVLHLTNYVEQNTSSETNSF